MGAHEDLLCGESIWTWWSTLTLGRARVVMSAHLPLSAVGRGGWGLENWHRRGHDRSAGCKGRRQIQVPEACLDKAIPSVGTYRGHEGQKRADVFCIRGDDIYWQARVGVRFSRVRWSHTCLHFRSSGELCKRGLVP